MKYIPVEEEANRLDADPLSGTVWVHQFHHRCAIKATEEDLVAILGDNLEIKLMALPRRRAALRVYEVQALHHRPAERAAASVVEELDQRERRLLRIQPVRTRFEATPCQPS